MSHSRADIVLGIVVLGLGLAAVPSDAGAQDRRSHWGVTVGFSPRWVTPGLLDTTLERLWDESGIHFSGSEFRAGVVRGSELGGDAGVSFVRRPFDDGSGFVREHGVQYGTRGVVLTGVEAHKFTPFGTIRDRVQIGLDYGAGVGVFDGVVDATVGVCTREVSVGDALDPWGIGIVPIGRLELAVAVIAAPGLKVRAKGGVNFPGVQRFSVSASYLFGAR